MGLFLAPFSGHAVGGGGHGVIDPPPPGADPGSGPRAEVDTVGRTPLRLLRTTMARHKPKFMKIVPPGQQRGTLAPPYTWDTLERPDWRYETPKRSSLRMGEGEFDAPHPLKPKPLGPPKPSGSTATAPKPRFARPSGDPAMAARRQRIDAIHREIEQIKADLKALHQKRHELYMLGKRDLASRQTTAVPGGFVSHRLEDNDLPIGMRPEDQPRRERRTNWTTTDTPGPAIPTRAQQQKITRRNIAQNELYQRHITPGPQGEPSQKAQDLGRKNLQPAGSQQLVQVMLQIQAKKRRLQQLTQELRQLRQQARSESIGLTRNNLQRQNLLLK